MYRPPAVLVLVVALLYASTVRAEESIKHLIDSAFFEVIENGKVPSDLAHVALNIWTGKSDGQAWANCQWVLITTNKAQRSQQLFLFSASTEEGNIKNLMIDQDTFSFDIALWPDRPLRVVAAGKAGTNNYKIGASGLWSGLLKKSEFIKVEWRQIPSITLPYNTITR
jgi:hypothetical protein